MENRMNLIWFRTDLRVDDNPALFNACKSSEPLIGVYFLCPQQDQDHKLGDNYKYLRLIALNNLKLKLAALNIPLLVLKSDNYLTAIKDLKNICECLSVEQLFFNQEYAVNEQERDIQLILQLEGKVEVNKFNGDPYSKQVKQRLAGEQLFCYQIPTAKPENNLHLLQDIALPNQNSGTISQVDRNSQLLKLNSIDIESKLEIKHPINEPIIDEVQLRKQLIDFSVDHIGDYEQERDFPNLESTSQLSFGLAVGAISVRRCYQIAKDTAPSTSDSWLNELIWRDFYRYVMWHFPHVSKSQGFRPVDKNLVWSRNEEQLERWKNGQTGIPIIDAAMKQLTTTGWMHNRLRMVTACYLCKNLWIDWRKGEAFFAQHLFDYDFASNNGGWQWCASVGTDSAPYFRVFNPASQQKRFDPDAHFIKKWLPELAGFSAKEIHNFESKPLPGYYPIQTDLKASRKLAIENFKMAMK
jgi:deoxyribodipyrimidine photo-lyase